MSARDTGVNDCGPILLSTHESAIRNAQIYDERTHVPPGCDTRDGPGGRVYVVEVGRCWYDLLARYDTVGGEGANRWVVPATEKAEPMVEVIGCSLGW